MIWTAGMWIIQAVSGLEEQIKSRLGHYHKKHTFTSAHDYLLLVLQMIFRNNNAGYDMVMVNKAGPADLKTAPKLLADAVLLLARIDGHVKIAMR